MTGIVNVLFNWLINPSGKKFFNYILFLQPVQTQLIPLAQGLVYEGVPKVLVLRRGPRGQGVVEKHLRMQTSFPI